MQLVFRYELGKYAKTMERFIVCIQQLDRASDEPALLNRLMVKIGEIEFPQLERSPPTLASIWMLQELLGR